MRSTPPFLGGGGGIELLLWLVQRASDLHDAIHTLERLRQRLGHGEVGRDDVGHTDLRETAGAGRRVGQTAHRHPALKQPATDALADLATCADDQTR